MIKGVQEMISEQAEASNKCMMEAIQTAMKESTITHQQINKCTTHPPCKQ